MGHPESQPGGQEGQTAGNRHSMVVNILSNRGRTVETGPYSGMLEGGTTRVGNFLSVAGFPKDSPIGEFVLLRDAESRIVGEIRRLLSQRGRRISGEIVNLQVMPSVQGYQALLGEIRRVRKEIGREIFGDAEIAEEYATRIQHSMERGPTGKGEAAKRRAAKFKEIGDNIRDNYPRATSSAHES